MLSNLELQPFDIENAHLALTRGPGHILVHRFYYASLKIVQSELIEKKTY